MSFFKFRLLVFIFFCKNRKAPVEVEPHLMDGCLRGDEGEIMAFNYPFAFGLNYFFERCGDERQIEQVSDGEERRYLIKDNFIIKVDG